MQNIDWTSYPFFQRLESTAIQQTPTKKSSLDSVDGPASKAPEKKKSTEGFEVREAPTRRISTTKPPPMAPLPDLAAQPAVELAKKPEDDGGFVLREAEMKKRRDSKPFKSLPKLIEPALIKEEITEEAASSVTETVPTPTANGTNSGHDEETVEVMLKFNVGVTVTLPKGFTFAQLEWAAANQQMPTGFEFR